MKTSGSASTEQAPCSDFSQDQVGQKIGSRRVVRCSIQQPRVAQEGSAGGVLALGAGWR